MSVPVRAQREWACQAPGGADGQACPTFADVGARYPELRSGFTRCAMASPSTVC